MIKTLTAIGNSKAVILPAVLVKRYNLKKVAIESTKDGILIRAEIEETSFQKKINRLKSKKDSVYKRMAREADDKRTIAYYNSHNNLGELGL